MSQVVLTSVEEEEEYGARSGTASASGGIIAKSFVSSVNTVIKFFPEYSQNILKFFHYYSKCLYLNIIITFATQEKFFCQLKCCNLLEIDGSEFETKQGA